MKYIVFIGLLAATSVYAGVQGATVAPRAFAATTGTTTATTTPIVQQLSAGAPVSFAAPVAIRSPQLFAVRTSPSVYTASTQVAPGLYSAGAGGQAMAIRTVSGSQTGSSFVSVAPFQAPIQQQQPATVFAAPAQLSTGSGGVPLTIQLSAPSPTQTSVSSFASPIPANIQAIPAASAPVLAFSAGNISPQIPAAQPQQLVLTMAAPMAAQPPRQQLLVAPQMFTMSTGNDCQDFGGFSGGQLTQGIQLQMPLTTAVATNC